MNHFKDAKELSFFSSFCPDIISSVEHADCNIVYRKIAEQFLIQFSETNLFIFDLRIDRLI
jgi:hypothetical protein